MDRRSFLAVAGLTVTAAACGGHRPNSGTAVTAPPVTRLIEPYGDSALQAGEWFVPSGNQTAPTVVLIHGGFWAPEYDRHLEDKVALDLAARGYLCWNLDYRSSTAPWPATLTDVAAGYDHLLGGHFASRIDPQRVAIVGHSAGGQLAAWLAGRHRLSHGAPGGNGSARAPALVVSQAGVVALTIAAREDLGGGAPQAFIGGTPAQFPQRYLDADPVDLLPTGVRSVMIHDRGDDIVPVSQSQTYVRDATVAHDDSTLVLVPGNHFSHLDPKSEACQRMRDALATMTG
jgi:acetyl esterase/lipase